MRIATTATMLCLSLLAVPGLAACGPEAAGTEEQAPPAVVEEIQGSDVKKVVFTEDADAAVGIKTAAVAAGPAAGQLRLPYSAVIYYLDGTSWTYTVTAPHQYLRVPITISSISGAVATLSKGPAVGTRVVTVGAPEVLGAELEIDGEQ